MTILLISKRGSSRRNSKLRGRLKFKSIDLIRGIYEDWFRGISYRKDEARAPKMVA